jgi:hypothetical protein
VRKLFRDRVWVGRRRMETVKPIRAWIEKWDLSGPVGKSVLWGIRRKDGRSARALCLTPDTAPSQLVP